MPFSYKPFWKMLIDLDMSKKEFRELTGISASTLTRMAHNDYIAMKIIDDICTKLHCTPNDIMQHIPIEKEK